MSHNEVWKFHRRWIVKDLQIGKKKGPKERRWQGRMVKKHCSGLWCCRLRERKVKKNCCVLLLSHAWCYVRMAATFFLLKILDFRILGLGLSLGCFFSFDLLHFSSWVFFVSFLGKFLKTYLAKQKKIQKIKKEENSK